MACEVLGPRGDEKSGCRDAWIAFCALNEKPSVISSFKANRFNNLFEAAAALTYHRDDIITFLRDYMPDKNSKLQSPGWCHQWPGCCLPADFGLVVLQTDWAILAASRVQNTSSWFLQACGPDERSAWPVESEWQRHLQCRDATTVWTANARLCVLQGCHPSCWNNKAPDLQHLPVTVWWADHRGGSAAERLSASGTLPCSHWSSNATEACPFPDNESAGGGMLWRPWSLCLQKTECIPSPPCRHNRAGQKQDNGQMVQW